MGMEKHQKIAVALTASININTLKKKKRKMWVKKYLLLRDKISNMEILNVLEPSDLRNYLRVGIADFEYLLKLVTPYIQKEDTLFRKSVSAKQRLAVTLRFLATGNSYQDLRFSSLISQPLLSAIIPETCRAIFKCLKHYIKIPESETEWKETAEEFETKWNFSHCVGSCDGKHIAIQKPPNSGSLFYNYKGFFSIVLFAVVNANYEFMYVHTGTNGSVADGAILKSTAFYKKMVSNTLNLPSPSPLPGTNEIVPYVFLGDSAFALNKNLLKPFPFRNIDRKRRIFNYRLSRARRVVENAFGILSSRFRVLCRPLNLDLDNVDAVVLACCALHNFLAKRVPTYISHPIDSENTTQATFSQEDWRQTTEPLLSFQHFSNNQPNEDGNIIRNKFMEYFNSIGSISFQDQMIDAVRP